MTTRHDLSTSKCRCDSLYLGIHEFIHSSFLQTHHAIFYTTSEIMPHGSTDTHACNPTKNFSQKERNPQKYISYLSIRENFAHCLLYMGSHLLGALNNPSMFSAHSSFCKTFSSKLPKEEEIKSLKVMVTRMLHVSSQAQKYIIHKKPHSSLIDLYSQNLACLWTSHCT